MYFLKVNEKQTLQLSQTSIPEYSSSQCLVKVATIGVNRADLLQKQGKYPPPVGASSIIGLEVCGEVVACGALVSQFNVGDRVMGLLAGGGYSEFVNVEASHLLPLPKHFSVTQGGAFIETFITAYQSLFKIGQLLPKQRVLIHAGASGVGTAAIALAKSIDCHVTITASTALKCDACLTLGADIAINYNEHDFLTYCKDKKLQFDVIIDVVASEYVNKNIALANMDAHIVIVSMLGGRFAQQIDVAKMLLKRVNIHATTLRNRSDEYKADLIQSFVKDFGELLYQSKSNIMPVIDSVYNWQDVNKAHQRLALNNNVGKVVLTL